MTAQDADLAITVIGVALLAVLFISCVFGVINALGTK